MDIYCYKFGKIETSFGGYTFTNHDNCLKYQSKIALHNSKIT